ncbi:hypothetical protein ABZP36_006636 [Zizania latifolia]
MRLAHAREVMLALPVTAPRPARLRRRRVRPRPPPSTARTPTRLRPSSSISNQLVPPVQTDASLLAAARNTPDESFSISS